MRPPLRPLSLTLALWLLAAPALAETGGPQLTADGDGAILHNPGPAPIVALRVGEQRLIRLGPGESAPLNVPADSAIAGRFDIDDWSRALDDLAPGWADMHLRTAGHFLDTVDAGPAGAPSASINLRLLADVPPETMAEWARGPALRRALAARAARHVPPRSLGPLLVAVDPSETHAEWPAAYAALPPLIEGVQRAIELHGRAALPALRAHPRWAAERGVGAQFDPPTPIPDAAAALARALDAGQFDRAATIAAGLVAQPGPRDATLNRQLCGALDTAAQQALRAGRLLAAEGWLQRAGPVCGLLQAERTATLFRARGDLRRQMGDLRGAVGPYRAAFWLAEAPQDRARLADTHAELALLRFGEGSIEAGEAHLEAARALDSLRPRVQAAIEARPTVDLRARVGIVLIILVMGVFVMRRLRKVFRGDRIPGTRAALKARRGPW